MLRDVVQIDYRERVRGTWLGKNIGGTLGAPVEGEMGLLDLTGYLTSGHTGPLPNDDLDLQLLWLSVLERHGLNTDRHVLAQAWLDHVRFPYNEYGYALRNLRGDLPPPLSGSFDNPFGDCMGAPIRTEIWACVAPGRPALAAYLAYQDAIVDHAGEGVWGATFWAALESLALVGGERDALLDAALHYLPAECATARAVRDVRRWHATGLPWQENRARILEHHGNLRDFTDAPQNIAFAVLGWLYGTDFGDALLKTVNCGFDTDSSGAMLGALLGMLLGADAIPRQWRDPMGDRVVVSPEVGGFPHPTTLDELTDRTVQLGERFAAELRRPATPLQARLSLATPVTIAQLWSEAPDTVRWDADHGGTGFGLQVNVTYPQGPAAPRGGLVPVHVTVHNVGSWPHTGQLAVDGGSIQDLQLAPGGAQTVTFSVPAVAPGAPTAQLQLTVLEGGIPWRTLMWPLATVASRCWSITSSAADQPPITLHTDGVTLDLAALTHRPVGEITALTHLQTPFPRSFRLMVISQVPIEARLDGEVVLQATGDAWQMPSPHMSTHVGFDASCWGDLTLGHGQHALQLRFPAHDRTGQPTRLFVALGELQGARFQHPTDVAFT